jgi:hypothetical protein
VFEGLIDRWVDGDPGRPAVPKDPQIAIHMRRTEPRAATLAGTWEVESVKMIGELLASHRADPSTWRRLVVNDKESTAHVTFANGRTDEFRLEPSPDGCMTLTTRALLTYELAADDLMHLEGRFRGHDLSIRLKRRDPKDFLLLRRSFQWINEVPFNRY